MPKGRTVGMHLGGGCLDAASAVGAVFDASRGTLAFHGWSIAIIFVLVFFLVFFHVFLASEVVEVGKFFEHGAGFGDVEAFGSGLDCSDYIPANRVADAGGVGAGELETIEQGGCTSGFEFAGGQRVDDDGERRLDGLAVFEDAEFDVLAGDEISAGLGRIAVGLMALMQAGVEVAPLAFCESGRLALDTVGLDVSA
jgi:hypothetical protein